MLLCYYTERHALPQPAVVYCCYVSDGTQYVCLTTPLSTAGRERTSTSRLASQLSWRAWRRYVFHTSDRSDQIRSDQIRCPFDDNLDRSGQTYPWFARYIVLRSCSPAGICMPLVLCTCLPAGTCMALVWRYIYIITPNIGYRWCRSAYDLDRHLSDVRTFLFVFNSTY